MQTIIPDSEPGGTPLGDVAELNARRTAAEAVLGDYKAAVASAPVTSPPGREWMLRLASVLGGLLGALDDQDDLDDEFGGREPYCTECGSWCGMFFGLAGWHHFKGDPSPGGKRELTDPGHEAVVAWCRPPGRSLSPADAEIVRLALADAEAYRRDRAEAWCADCQHHPAGACEEHVDQLDQADAYAAAGRQLQEGETDAC